MSDGYMTLVFPSGMDEPFLSLFEDAQAYWNGALLSSGIGSANLGGSSVPGGCLISYTFPSPFIVEGAVLLAEFAAIDGSGGTLAQAGVCTFDNNLPRLGVMQFDTADSQSLLDQGNFGEVIRHEMAHSFGLGSAWTNFNLVEQSCFFGFCFGSGLYTGANGNEGLADLGGSGQIEIEGDGGAGTAGAHWDEVAYENELMTGFLNAGVFNPASVMTIKSFIDMGYEVDLSAAEAFTLPKEGFTGEKIALGMDNVDLGYRETSDWLANGETVTVHTLKYKNVVEFAAFGVALTALVAFVAAFAYRKRRADVDRN